MNKLNPCVTGDTKVFTVNGVETFRELAEKNNDVMVYCLNDDGEIKNSKMLHPRLSGYNVVIMKITLADGTVLKVTPQHMLLTKNGYVSAEDILEGEEIVTINKDITLPDEVEDAVKPYVNFLSTKKGTIIKKCEVTGDDFECDWDEREICAKEEFGSELYTGNIEKLKVLISESVGNYSSQPVINVEVMNERQNVYNGTVSVYHNYFTIDEKTNTIVNQLNCGE